MLPEALLVCSHEESARALVPVLEGLGTHVERHRDTMAALGRLWTVRYDAVIVDCAGGQGDEAEVVREVREVGLNKNAITIAVIGADEDPDEAYALGAHFVLRKPLQRVRVERMLRAAHVLITQERRKFRRHLCDGPATVIAGAAEIHAELIDLSHGGVALQLAKTHEIPDTVSLRFDLPGTRDSVTPRASVAWRNQWGRVGLQFTDINGVDRTRLSRWLQTRPDRD
jgi:CheY-like chemotaxis protein